MDPYKRALISFSTGADINEKYATKGHGSKKERKRRAKDAKVEKKKVRRQLKVELNNSLVCEFCGKPKTIIWGTLAYPCFCTDEFDNYE